MMVAGVTINATVMRALLPQIGHGHVHVFPAGVQHWQATRDAGLQLMPVRHDDARGHFFGLVRFAALARSGLHQHRGVATSFVLQGGLTDYEGALALHQAGINHNGSTHDAVAYEPTLLVSRLEAPVSYPPSADGTSGLHAGSHEAVFANPAPERACDRNVTVDALPRVATGLPGIERQTIFDYAGSGSAHRFVQLRLRPQSHTPVWQASALTELWVRGGELWLEHQGREQEAAAQAFVVIEPGAMLRWRSPFGALVLAWAEGPALGADLFGF